MPSGSAALAHQDAGVEQSQVLLLSTDQRVYGFELTQSQRITLGRHDDSDLRFSYRNISSRHAEIVYDGEALLVRDLESTNGTYVNGSRIGEHVLQDGDIVRIGKYEIQVMLSGADRRGEKAAWTISEDAGMFLQTSIPDEAGAASLRDALMQILSSGKSCTVLLFGPGEEIQLYLRDGKIVHAEGDDVLGDKAVFRAFEWVKGTFRVSEFPVTDSLPHSVTLPSPKIIELGAEQAAEIFNLRERLPMPHMRLELREDSKVRICELSPAEFEVFQAIVRFRTLARTLKESRLADIHTLRAADSLIRRGVLQQGATTNGVQDTMAPDQTQGV